MPLQSQQTPQQEIAERVAEAAPGLGVAAHLVGLDSVRRNIHALRKQVAMDRANQSRVLGSEPAAAEADDDMGHLIVTGDIYGNNADQILQALQGGSAQTPTTVPTVTTPTPPSLQEEPPAATSALPNWTKAALVAAGLLGGAGLGAGIPWLLGAYNKVGDTTVVNQGDSQALDVEVVPGGALK